MILGAGYAGLTIAQGVSRSTRGGLPVILVDRLPVHVLRTELYEVGEMAAHLGERRWSVPLTEVLENSSVEYRAANVEAIDLHAQEVRLDSGTLPYKSLAICLGSTPAYYGVAGAAEHTHHVYGLAEAKKLAQAIRDVEVGSARLSGERRPRIVVIGGGSTGTELAADIATTNWQDVAAPGARAPEVDLVTGALPFLAGLPEPLIRHARQLLQCAGVNLIIGLNTTRIGSNRVELEDGTVLAADITVWCAGVQTPPLVRNLPVPHGRGGRIPVSPSLEIPGFSGAFAVGDVAEVRDPRSQLAAPTTAQVAVAEARAATQNIVARWQGRPTRPFAYRGRGIILAMGRHRGAATVRHITVWGGPASWLKRLVEWEYARSTKRGKPSGIL